MNQPLKNKTFISTRPAGRSDELTALFEKAGAKVLEMPLIKIQAADFSDPEKKWLQNTEQFQWLVFTSPNGVNYFFEALSAISAKDHIPPSVQIAVIGTKTEKILNKHGHTASFVNPGNTGEDFAEAFGKKLSGQSNRPNVLLALGNL
ncbi:MAG: uroporphyrinogen-III synthase, partial [Prolixibacteraceae bacterium]